MASLSLCLKNLRETIPKALENFTNVLLDVVSVTNDGFEGRVYSYDRLTNGFKIGYTGTADSVTVHWTVVNGLQQ